MSKALKRFSIPSADRQIDLVDLPLASFSRRAAAMALDFSIAGGIFLVATVLGGLLLVKAGVLDADGDYNLSLGFNRNWYSGIWLALYFGPGLYLGNGQTPGKRLMKIRVVSLLHERIGFWHAIERALGYGASALEAGMGFFQYFWSENRRTTHDRIADTIVVDERPQHAAGAVE
jgi:uncharacterized RDD family membrane protein YckC